MKAVVKALSAGSGDLRDMAESMRGTAQDTSQGSVVVAGASETGLVQRPNRRHGVGGARLAARVLSKATELGTQADRLRSEVDQFLRGIRAK